MGLFDFVGDVVDGIGDAAGEVVDVAGGALSAIAPEALQLLASQIPGGDVIAPLIGKALAGGLSALSDSENAKLTEALNDQNLQIAMQNFGLQQELFDLQKANAEWQQGYIEDRTGIADQRYDQLYDLFLQDRAKSDEGVTDASGNRTKYVPGRGYVTILSPQQQALQDTGEAALLEQLGAGSARQQADERARFDAAGRDRNMAEAMLRELQGVRREQPGDLARLLAARGKAQFNDAADRVGDAAARGMASRGNLGVNANSFASMRARDDILARAMMDQEAAARGLELADSRFNNRRSNAASLYDIFRTRGSQSSGAGTPQPNIGSPGVVNPPAAPAVPGGMSPGVQLPYNAPQQDYIGGPPFSSTANMYQGFADVISGGLQANQADADTSALLEQLLGGLNTAPAASGKGNTGTSPSSTNTYFGSSNTTPAGSWDTPIYWDTQTFTGF